MKEVIEIKNPQLLGFSRIIIRIILWIFILIFCIVGLFGLILIGDSGNLFNGLSFLVIGFGLGLFLFMGLMSLKWNERYEIFSFSFDTFNQKFFIKQKNGEQGFIPFNELVEFKTRVHIQSGKNSRKTYYVVYVLKKDRAFWDLTFFSKEDEAKNFAENLKSKVKFENKEIFQDDSKLKIKHRVTEDSFQTKIYWKGHIPLFQKVFTLLGILGFLSAFYNIFIIGIEFNSIGGYIATVIFLIFATVIGFFVFKSYFDFKEFELIIDSSTLTLFGIKSSQRKDLNRIQVAEIISTKFQFNIFETNGHNMGILILNKETEELFEKIKSGPKDFSEAIDYLQDVLKFEKKVIKLKFVDFTPIDILNFEKDLDRNLKKYNPSLN